MSAVVVRAWLEGLTLTSKERSSLLERLGIEDEDLSDLDGFVTRSQHRALVEWAVEQRGPLVGLHAAGGLERGAFSVIEYMMRTSADFEQALAQLIRFQRLLGPPDLFSTEADGVVSLRVRPEDGPDSIVFAIEDFALASFVVVARNATARPWRPSMLSLRRTQPSEVEPYETLFDCPVQFEARSTALSIRRDALGVPMAEADRRLNDLLVRLGRKVALAGMESESLQEQVRGVLVELLPQSRASLGHVSDRLGLSRRTLQSRLQDEGTSLSRLLDDVRRQLALRYLKEASLSIPDIVALLDYSEPSAFHRAFKRWTGMTPREFRRK